MTCGIIPPRYYQMIIDRDDGYLPECILEKNHGPQHVFRTPEGKFIVWEDDWECGCCEPEEDDRCIVYGEIGESEIPNLPQGRT